MQKDGETAIANYMFIHHGVLPSVVAALPTREKILIARFLKEEGRRQKARASQAKPKRSNRKR